MTKPSEIVQLLLNDEQLASLDQSGGLTSSKGKQPEKKEGESMGDLWNDDGDDFFGSGVQVAPNGDKGDDDAGTPAASGPQKKQRKSKATGAPRGRKPGKKKVDAAPTPAESEM